jgi:hypothetical protein
MLVDRTQWPTTAKHARGITLTKWLANYLWCGLSAGTRHWLRTRASGLDMTTIC